MYTFREKLKEFRSQIITAYYLMALMKKKIHKKWTKIHQKQYKSVKKLCTSVEKERGYDLEDWRSRMCLLAKWAGKNDRAKTRGLYKANPKTLLFEPQFTKLPLVLGYNSGVVSGRVRLWPIYWAIRIFLYIRGYLH